jgi:GNAT superfamily N-acetyltransferase
LDSVEIREILKSEIEQLNSLVSRAFSYPPGGSFLDDFPVWKTDRVIRLGLFVGGELASHVGIRFANMRTSGAPEPDGASVRLTPVALIGGVATSEAHRGKGYSTALLTAALKRIDASPAQWTLLWGSEHEFYQKFGFAPQGRQARALLADLSINTKDVPSGTPRSGFTGPMAQAIFEDLCSRKAGIEFSTADRPWVFAQKTVEWHSLDGPFAYVAYQRGLDMKNIVHETGGALPGVMKLLLQVYRKNPDAEILGRPADLLALGLDPAFWLEEPLCLARPKVQGTPWNPEFWVSGLSSC